MTTYAPPRQPPPSAPGPPPGGPGPGRHAVNQTRGRRHAAWTGSVVAPAAAGIATLCASTALTGVIRGGEWFLHILVTILLIGCTGLALRSVRAPALAVGFGQLAVLVMLITGLYTSHGILGVFPGPAAMSELNDVLSSAGEQIRTSLPPVDGTAGILCLATIGIGLVAVVVDTLAVSLAAPAAAGLVLLCLYAVPASLADEMLPWWSFAIGAAAFAALIAVDGNHRHRQWRGRGPRASTVERAGGAASLPAAVVATAMSLGLLAGATLTAIGTVGHLPFTEEGTGGGGSGALGLEPMTRLQGLLGDQGSAEVFRVAGLGGEERLLRAFTLDDYQPNVGWQLSSPVMPRGMQANAGPLEAVGDRGGPTTQLKITPANWQDIWLPVYGQPRRVENVGDNWIYDEISGSIYSERPKKPKPYTLYTSLEEPSAKQLQSAPLAADEVEPIYSREPELTFRLKDKIREIVDGARSPFAKARAIRDYFINTGGFTYDLETDEAGDSDALEHFVLDGKRGFCSQFASAMAVMVRSEGIPARVAVGFTAGTRKNNYRSITTRDAHAWVEVYLGREHGWVAFDPTPLAGGRGITPPYLEEPESDTSSSTPDIDDPVETTEPDTPQANSPDQQETPDQANARKDEVSLAQAPSWAVWPTLLIILLAAAATVFGVALARQTAELRAGGRRPDEAALRRSAAGRWLPTATAGGWLLSLGLLGWMVSWWLALLLVIIAAVAVAPALLREVGRNTRLHDVTVGTATAPRAAWRELLAECGDRGTSIREADTVRETARRLATEYNLDGEGRRHLQTVVTTLERNWYGGEEITADPEFTAAFEGLRRSLNASAPLPLSRRLLPSSVLKRP